VTLLGIDFPPISHVTRWPDILFKDTAFGINKTVLIYFASVLITLLIFFAAARKHQLVPRGVQNIAESSVDFVRESVILQTIGPEGMGYLPFLTTMFFFVFFINIFEILPFIQFPGNARIAVPLFLALVVWFIFNIVGIAKQGFGSYMKSSLVPPGVPKAILPLMVFIEFISTFIVRPFSLAIRLFANMLAGHLILVTFAILTSSIFGAAVYFKIGAAFPFALLVALTAFEILVSGLQAFIFTILTGVYIGLAMHPEH
jgi:F-type H+-transporting ATPase subunit a